jgi:hypothetical protein
VPREGRWNMAFLLGCGAENEAKNILVLTSSRWRGPRGEFRAPHFFRDRHAHDVIELVRTGPRLRRRVLNAQRSVVILSRLRRQPPSSRRWRLSPPVWIACRASQQTCSRHGTAVQ